MGRSGYLGEFEQIVLLAVARLGDEAYGMRIRAEIEARAGGRRRSALFTRRSSDWSPRVTCARRTSQEARSGPVWPGGSSP